MLKTHLFRVGLAAVTTLALIGCNGGAPSTTDPGNQSKFILSAIPDEKITDQKVKFDTLAAYLTDQLGVTSRG